MRVAIHENKDVFNHSTMWSTCWVEYCKENNIDYETVDCFSNNILEKIKDFDILLWNYSNYSHQEKLFARKIMTVIKNLGIKIFPDIHESWHFDDKIAETYLLKSVNAPLPKSYMFYTKKSAVDFFENTCKFPIVAKLRSGSGSNNVVLLRNKNEAMKYTKKMFGKGFKAAPNIFFKAKSNIRSSKNWDTVVKRFKRIPDFIKSYKNGSMLPNEKGYVYLQEFIENEGYDLKVVVVGDKLTFLKRNVRKNDFRASGGGDLNFDKNFINDKIRKIAFDTSRKLNFSCMGYDFVIDKATGEPIIIEICYGFSHTAQMGLGGYWDSENKWYDGEVNAPKEVLRELIRRLEK